MRRRSPPEPMSEALERALAVLADDCAPAALRVRVALIAASAQAKRARSPRPHLPRLNAGIAAALAAAGALAVPLVLLGGGAVPSVAEAVALSARPPVVRVHEPSDGHVTLPRVHAAGLSFPYWGDRFGWKAIGFRRDTVGGRTLSTVFYVRDGRRVAYTIVSGPPLAARALAGAHATVLAGTRLRTAALGGRALVTWLRRGHTCVLSGAGVSAGELLALGSWRGGGAIPY
jgi:hypothetical protein